MQGICNISMAEMHKYCFLVYLKNANYIESIKYPAFYISNKVLIEKWLLDYMVHKAAAF